MWGYQTTMWPPPFRESLDESLDERFGGRILGAAIGDVEKIRCSNSR
jgi:hypothetical protein